MNITSQEKEYIKNEFQLLLAPNKEDDVEELIEYRKRFSNLDRELIQLVLDNINDLNVISDNKLKNIFYDELGMWSFPSDIYEADELKNLGLADEFISLWIKCTNYRDED